MSSSSTNYLEIEVHKQTGGFTGVIVREIREEEKAIKINVILKEEENQRVIKIKSIKDRSLTIDIDIKDIKG